MPNRRVSVTIDADTGPYSAGLASASAQTRVFARELSSADTDVDHFGGTLRSAGNDIDRYSGRLAALGQAAAAVGPSILPIAAGAIPLVTTLANQFGFAAIAGGSAILAFQGVGDALDALNTYQLDPSAANLQKLNEAMAQLGPETQEFVRHLQSLRPLLDELRAAAGEGLFPGLTDGLDAIATRGPEIERIIRTVSGTLGDLLAEGGESLAGPEWDDFFTSLETEARPALMDLGHALGDVTHGFAELWQAFLPLDRDISSGLVRMARGFDSWATGLDQTEGFQEFIDYVRETGPQVVELLGSVGNMFVQIAQAAAPLGGPVLASLTAIADAVAAIADSDLGTPIMALVTALSAYKLALRGATAISATAFAPAAIGGRVKELRGSLKGLSTDLGVVGTTWATAGARSEREAARMKASTDRIKGAFGELGKGAAVLGGVGFVASGMADDFGLANTATLALAGSFAGPLGAAIGGGVGLFLDATSAASSLEDQLHALATSNDVKVLQANLEAVEKKRDDLADVTGVGDWFSDAATGLGELFHGNFSALTSKTAGLSEPIDQAKDKIADLKRELESGVRADAMRQGLDLTAAGLRNATASAEDFTRQLTIMQGRLSDRASMRDFEAAIDAMAASVKENGRTLNIATAAGRANQAALDNIATTALKVSENMTGLERIKFLDRTRSAFVDAAVKAGKSEAAAKRLADRLISLGNIKAQPTIGIDDQASGQIELIKQRIGGIHGRTVTIAVQQRRAPLAPTSLLTGAPIMPADGTTVPGARMPYGDRVPALLAPGEEVISNRHGQADRHRSLLKAINDNRMASGGTAGDDDRKRRLRALLLGGSGDLEELRAEQSIRDLLRSLRETGKHGRHTLRGLDRDVTQAELREARKELRRLRNHAEERKAQREEDREAKRAVREKELRDSLDLNTKSLDTATAAYDAVQQRAGSLSSSVSSGLTSSLFGPSAADLAWLSPEARRQAMTGDLFATLRGDTAAGQRFNALQGSLATKGLSGDALQALIEQGGLPALEAFNAMSGADLARYQQLFDQRSMVLAGTGQAAGNLVYGQQLAASQAQVDQLTAQNQHLQKLVELAAAGNEIARGNPGQVGKELKNPTKDAVRRHRGQSRRSGRRGVVGV